MLPSPGSLSTSIRPPWLSTIERGDREAETDALDVALGGLAGPEEAGEQPVAVRAAMPIPVSRDRQLDPLAVGAQPDHDAHRRAGCT